MKPYGFQAVGSGAWPSESPGKPHVVTTAGDAEISRKAARRRPRRAERQWARREIQKSMEDT